MEDYKDLTITRVYNAPRELVFKAWTDADQVAQWWGPEGFTNPVCRVDARPGGEIYIGMKGPDGNVYPMAGTFKDIEAPERLSFVSYPLDEQGNHLFEVLTLVTFSAMGNKTEVILHAYVSKITAAAKPALDGMDEGWKQTLDRLGNFTSDAFTIERTYNATADKVWRAITEKEQMKEWYFDLADFQPVAGFEFEFTGGPDERQYLHKCKVTEVIPGKKIAYSWRYEGYEGNSFVSFELFPQGTRTTLKLTHVGLGTFPATNADLAKGNFAMGWNDIIGRSLAAYLEKA